MRSQIIAAAVVAGLLETRAARAEDPCAADVKQFCGEVQVGGGRVQNCLRENDAKLSPACRERRAAVEEKFRGIVMEFGQACQPDVTRLCSEVQPGQGRVLACLLRQQDFISSSCRRQTDRYQAAAETVTNVRAACKADVERLCAGAGTDARSTVECLQANRESVSQTCGSVDTQAGMAAAELVDAVEALTSKERLQETQQILQGIDAIAFSRSQLLVQVDSYQGLGGSANANRLLFNPQLVFGPHNEFSVQLKVPVLAVYPYAPDRNPQTGLGAITTAFAWAFFRSKRVNQFASFGLNWISPVQPPVGGAWAVSPAYAISVGLIRGLSITGQVVWVRSFASSGFPEVNALVFDPIVVASLPGRSFVAVDTKLGWNIEGSSFVPVVKGLVGIYVDRQKSLAGSAWYQTSLSDVAAAQTFKFEVGLGLAYYFDW